MIKVNIQKDLDAPTGTMNLDVQFELEPGQLLSIYGKSGAGKTSILRMIAGLMPPKSGEIIVNQKIWFQSKSKTSLKPQQRNVGFLFQDYALFPNLTVKDNLLFALKKGQSPQIIEELIEITELGALQHKTPQRLSGGQKQRVALARALVQKPQLLLLDEPLAALDQEMRLKLQSYIHQVQKQYDLSIILISHDLEEIKTLSDQIIFVEQGQILTEKSTPLATIKPFEIKEGEFMGTIVDMNAFSIIVEHRTFSIHQFIEVSFPNGPKFAGKIGDEVRVRFSNARPNIIKL